MAIFAVVSDSESPALEKKIRDNFPADSISVSDHQWFVVADTTARALAEQLEVRGGSHGRAMVMEISGMPSGWHGKSAWDWLIAKVRSS